MTRRAGPPHCTVSGPAGRRERASNCIGSGQTYVSHSSFYSIHAPYLWSLMLRLCMVPKIKAMYAMKAEGEAEVAELLEDDERHKE